MPGGKSQQGWPEGAPLRWHAVVATGFAFLFVIIGIWSAIATWFNSVGVDFVSFWAAGRLTLAGDPSGAYDIALHHRMEQLVAPKVGIIPFPYPPPFLLLVSAFAIAPFGLAFTLWSAVTGGFYAYAASRLTPLRFAFGNAATCVTFMIGQTSFFFCGLFMLGLSLVSAAPFAAGVVLGLLFLKPQLGLLLPVAMLAGREWGVIAGAVLSTSAGLLLGAILFGIDAYVACWNILPHYVGFLRDGRLPWYEIASPFGVARFAGIPRGFALAIHVAIAAGATALTARAWWLKAEARVPILAASTMLMSPYLFTYDTLLIAVPIGWLVRHKCPPALLASIMACLLIPIITSFSPWVAPNTMPLAAIASLYGLHLPLAEGAGRMKAGDSWSLPGLDWRPRGGVG